MTAGDAKLQAGLGRIRLRFLSVLDGMLRQTIEADLPHADLVTRLEARMARAPVKT